MTAVICIKHSISSANSSDLGNDPNSSDWTDPGTDDDSNDPSSDITYTDNSSSYFSMGYPSSIPTGTYDGIYASVSNYNWSPEPTSAYYPDSTDSGN
jgi:hypothetical protein